MSPGLGNRTGSREGRLRDRMEHLLQRERLARERLELLAEAGRVLASTLDYEITLRRVIELTLPLLGDFGFFDVVDDRGDVRRLALAPDDPERQVLLDRTRWEGSPLPLQGLAMGDAAGVFSPLDAGTIEELCSSSRDQNVLGQLHASSLMVVPLRYQHRLLGGLSLFCKTEGERRHTSNDLTLAVELAQRASAAVENARLFHQAQEATRKRDEFLSVASHELKTPLTTLELQVTGLLRALRTGKVSPEESELVVERLDRVERQVQRMNQIIEELLDATRIGGERLRLWRGRFDLQDLVEEAVLQQRGDAERAGCEVQLNLERLQIFADRPRLRQVLQHLLSNAFKFGAGKPVEINLASLPNGVKLQVIDHGIGIAHEDQQRVFERFERAVSSRKHTGLGLGLWLVKQIVEAHGGRVSVISVPGVGSAFAVDLPT